MVDARRVRAFFHVLRQRGLHAQVQYGEDLNDALRIMEKKGLPNGLMIAFCTKGDWAAAFFGDELVRPLRIFFQYRVMGERRHKMEGATRRIIKDAAAALTLRIEDDKDHASGLFLFPDGSALDDKGGRG